MKCPNCGNNLNIEQKFCPYCGTKNEQAANHIQEMDKYDREFKDTQSQVMDNSRHFKSFTIKCTVIAILACIIILAIWGAQEYVFYHMLRDSRINSHKKEFTEKLLQLEEEREYLQIRNFIQDNDLLSSDSFREYTCVYSATMAYHTFVYYLHEIQKPDERSSYISDNECIDRISDAMDRIQKASVDDSYRQKYGMLSEPHMSMINDMKLEIQGITQAYFNLTDEETAGLWEMTGARRTVMLEEGLINE